MMYADIFNAETARFTFVLGIVLSIWLYDRLHITSGSIIAPAYIAPNLLNPVTLLVTAANALAAYLVVYRWLPRFVYLDGKQKLSTVILVSIALRLFIQETLGYAGHALSTDVLLVSVGYVIPGLLAHDIATQGVRRTLASVGALGLIIGLAAFVVAMVVPSPVGDACKTADDSLSFAVRWLPLAMLLSVLTSIALVHNHGSRAGGFVGAAYVSLLVAQPGELVYVAVLSITTYAVVSRLLVPHLIVFGRRKFAATMLIAAILSWGSLLMREQYFGPAGMPFSSSTFALISVTLTGLFANDIERFGAGRVLKGTVLAVVFTLSATLVVAELSGRGDPTVVLPLGSLAAVAGWIIFGPQLRWGFRLVTGDREKAGLPSAPFVRASSGLYLDPATMPAGVVLQMRHFVGGLSLFLLVGMVAASLRLVPAIQEAPLMVHNMGSPERERLVTEPRKPPTELAAAVDTEPARMTESVFLGQILSLSDKVALRPAADK